VALARSGAEVEYLNVKKDPEAMKRFLGLSGGDRRVPLLVEDGKITVGYEGS
jgi:glutaredoxin 3